MRKDLLSFDKTWLVKDAEKDIISCRRIRYTNFTDAYQPSKKIIYKALNMQAQQPRKFKFQIN